LELAAEEQDHHRILAEMASDPDLEEHLRARIVRPPTATRFQACIHLPALPEQPIEDDVLSYAEACEELAREHYGHLAEATPKGPLRDLFVFLHREEQRHAERMSARWSTMFSIL
jgi:rubrerythrin